MARTLTAHSPGLARTIIMVPTGCYMHNQSKEEGKDHELIQSSTTPDPGYQWENPNPGWLEISLARTIFHGPKPV